MEQGNKQNRDDPLPCANNCGFFGSPATCNLCSKCFRDSIIHLAEAQATVTETAAVTTGSSASAELAEPAAEEDGNGGGGGGAKRRRSRCAACGRKVGLMGFECRCGGVFCGAHRYSDRHDCGYDYRGAGRDAIARANPVVRADKQVDKL